MNRWLHHLRSTGSAESCVRSASAMIKYARGSSILRSGLLITALSVSGSLSISWAESPAHDQETVGHLTQISLEDLGNIEVTTTSKEPVKASETPAAIYVITQEDIRR